MIYQPGAFSCLQDGQWDEPVADSAYRAAREALAGADPTGGAIYYFNPQTATSEWIWSRPENPDNRQSPVLRLSVCQRDKPIRREKHCAGADLEDEFPVVRH